MAQAVLADALPQMKVSSAGTDALVGKPAEPPAQRLMVMRGLDISGHRAQQISHSLCQQADIILVMDHEQRRYLQSLYPLATGKVYRLGEFANLDVPDPYHQSPEMFEHTLAVIDSCTSGWIERMNRM